MPATTGRVDARLQGQVRTDILHRHEGVCLKHRAGFNGQKACDKFWNLLRIENTLSRPAVFTVYRIAPAPGTAPALPPSPGCTDLRVRANTCVPEQKPHRAWQPLRRSVSDVPRRAEVSRAANKRYLDALAS